MQRIIISTLFNEEGAKQLLDAAQDVDNQYTISIKCDGGDTGFIDLFAYAYYRVFTAAHIHVVPIWIASSAASAILKSQIDDTRKLQLIESGILAFHPVSWDDSYCKQLSKGSATVNHYVGLMHTFRWLKALKPFISEEELLAFLTIIHFEMVEGMDQSVRPSQSWAALTVADAKFVAQYLTQDYSNRRDSSKVTLSQQKITYFLSAIANVH